MRTTTFLILAVFFTACAQSPEGTKTEAGEAQEAKQLIDEGTTYKVDPYNSLVNWLGTKPGGEHYGTVKVSGGEVAVVDNQIASGTFEIDLNTIVDLDIENEEFNQKLVSHLKSEDFFYVDSFPKATFEIVDVEQLSGEANLEDESFTPTHRITGNLTMRGTTKSISFDAEVDMSGNSIAAKTDQFVLDRTNWGVNFKSKKIFSQLKDDFIHDEMAISIELNATKV
jgi:polyisoprenoid-binding protein YceI